MYNLCVGSIDVIVIGFKMLKVVYLLMVGWFVGIWRIRSVAISGGQRPCSGICRFVQRISQMRRKRFRRGRRRRRRAKLD